MNLNSSYSENTGKEDQSVRLRLLGMSAAAGAWGQTGAGTSPPWQLTEQAFPR